MLWMGWIAGTCVAWSIGWAVGFGVAGETFGGPVSGGVGGTLAALVQGRVLTRTGHSFGGVWALASAVLLLIGVAAGVAVSSASGGSVPPSVVGVPAMWVLTTAGQWLVLRARVPRAGWWPLATLAGVVAGGTAVLGLRIVTGNATVAANALGGAVLGGTMAAVNGAVLMRLLAWPPELSRAK